jgi:hypothetical protein
MTMTPTPRFATRPTVPAAGSSLDFQWRKDMTLAYPGGSITAARGNLEQTFALSGATSSYCQAVTESISRTGHSRVNKIGGTSTSVKATTFSVKKYPTGRSSQAAAGQAVEVLTGVGSYTARVSGSLQALMAYVCSIENSVFDYVTVVSQQGTIYGPVGPSTAPTP